MAAPRTCTAWLLLAMLLLLAAPTRAQSKEEMEKAREKFAQALAEQTAGNWDKALGILHEVERVKTTPQIRFNVALCEEHLGKLTAALASYRAAAEQADKEDVKQVADEARSRLDALSARVPKLTIRRGANAAVAVITLDERPLGEAELGVPRPVDPGVHVVRASASGSNPFESRLSLAEREAREIVVALTPGAAPGPAPGPRERDAGAGPGALPWIVGGVGLASLAASGVFFALRQSTIDDLDAKCGKDRAACPASERDTVDRGKTYNTVANVTLIVGAVGVATGVTLFVVGGKSKQEPAAAVAPITPGSVGLVGWF